MQIQNTVHNHTSPVVPTSEIIASLADTSDEYLGKTNTWTRYKVIVGLRRYADDLCDNEIKALPLGMTDYERKLDEFLTEFPSFRKLYPSYAAIRNHFESLSDGWLEVGFAVAGTTPRARRHKHVITEEIEAKLRQIYSDPDRAKRKCKELPGMSQYAVEIGIPKYYLIQHAVKLGLGFIKEPKWSDGEFKLLEELAHYAPCVIQRKFGEHGFKRTVTSIRLMRKRRRVHKQNGWYSLNSMAKLFGIDSHVAAGWVKENLLACVSKGTTRGQAETQTSGDTKLIHEQEIYRFVVANPTLVDLRKVDQGWFLYMITKGEIPFGGSDRITKRMEIGIEVRRETKESPPQ
jgi:hypothetical protein